MTIVEMAHPYPVQWEAMFKRLGNIETMVRMRSVDPAVRATGSTSDECPRVDDRPVVLDAYYDATHGDIDAMLRDLLDEGGDDVLDLNELR